MPSLDQVKEWSDKLELNAAEVSHWFRCKWRIKLMSPLLQAATSSPTPPMLPPVNGIDMGNGNSSYSRTDSGSDGGQGDGDVDDGFINIECETIVEEISQHPQEMAVS